MLPVESHHAPLLAEFFRNTWDPNSTSEKVTEGRARGAAENISEPGFPPPTFIALQGGRIIGYCSTLPLRLWAKGESRSAYWAKGLMVLPEFRGGPIGYHVLAALTKSTPLIAAVTVAEGSKRLFGALGYRDLGAIPNLVRPTQFRMALSQVRPKSLCAEGRLLKLVLGAAELGRGYGGAYVAGLALDGVSSLLFRERAGHNEVHVSESVDRDEIDSLWDRVKVRLSALPVRDYKSWKARYGLGPLSGYSYVTVRRDAELAGVALVKIPKAEGDSRLAGLRMASISDILVSPDDPALPLLLQASEARAAQLGAGAVIMSMTDRRLLDAARRRGYIRRPGNIHFFLKAPTDESWWPADLSSWWLTRGDGESDASF